MAQSSLFSGSEIGVPRCEARSSTPGSLGCAQDDTESGCGQDARAPSALRAGTLILRPYQEKARASIEAAFDRGLRRVLAVLPTGCGKTALFSRLVGDYFNNGKRSLCVAHRSELLEQAQTSIERVNPGLACGIEAGERRALNADCVVAGIQTVGRPGSLRLKEFSPDLLIIDEAHHACAGSYQHLMRELACYEEGGPCTLGVTATPHRMDNKPLHGSDVSIFEEIVFSYTLREAIADGWLCDLRGFRVGTGLDISGVKTTAGDYNQGQLERAVDTEERNRAAFEAWASVARERRTIVFCVGVDHAEHVAAMFSAEGVSAAMVCGAMDPEARASVMARFRSGAVQVLTNVDIATEGFDVPAIACVLMLRPTQSWSLYCQMIGRGTRPFGVSLGAEDDRLRLIQSSSKPDCIVIDVVDNSARNSAGRQPATLAGAVGLPERLDLDGHTLLEAEARLALLDEDAMAVLFRRECKYSELSPELHEIDLLGELAVVDEVAKCSGLLWAKLGDGRYLLSCGHSRELPERDRVARLVCDALGRFRVLLHSSAVEEAREVGDDLAQAFSLADSLVRQVWPDCGAIVSARAPWRSKPVTEGQVSAMRKWRVSEDVISRVRTQGQASRLIDAAINKARRRR